ncbi:MAG: hypothetical protein Q8P84_05495 [Deltaproteobacteria bacterium]|nr:hypothetical protein [Deltaproteobacteria bacterium]MDZ4224469.1 hypothetical protein [bacterium]
MDRREEKMENREQRHKKQRTENRAQKTDLRSPFSVFRSPFFVSLFSVFLLSSLFCPQSAFAKLPRKGFYKGPYIMLAGGAMEFNWDKNETTGVEEGAPWELLLGLIFGWNLNDWIAPEILLRFTTDKNEGRREYIAGANLGFVFTLLADPLLDFEKWRVLPFIKPGFGLQAAVLPGAANSTQNRLTSFGVGPSVGGGVRFLFKKYLYFGVEVQEEFLRQTSLHQDVNGANTLIYKGGWVNQFETYLTAGVHF